MHRGTDGGLNPSRCCTGIRLRDRSANFSGFQRLDCLVNQLRGLLRLGEKHAQSGKSIAFFLTRHLETVAFVTAVGTSTAQVVSEAGCAPQWANQIQVASALLTDNADIFEAVEETAAVSKALLQFLQLARSGVDSS